MWCGQLLADLRGELGIDRLDAVVVSGDISNRATAQEFDAATQFLRDLQDDFKLSPHQFVLVPGNHDLNWTMSKKSYRVLRREETEALVSGQYIDKGEFVEVPEDLGLRAASSRSRTFTTPCVPSPTRSTTSTRPRSTTSPISVCCSSGSTRRGSSTTTSATAPTSTRSPSAAR